MATSRKNLTSKRKSVGKRKIKQNEISTGKEEPLNEKGKK